MIIKHHPEDFLVEEIIDLHMEEGLYHYYRLIKKNWNTLDLIKRISQITGTNKIGFAGIKDKNAVTTQYISIFKKKISAIIPNVTFTYLGSGKVPIYRGMLKGNKFTITIRDLTKKLKPVHKVVNYFGKQRFGTQNAKIGELLVQKKFEDVCKLLNLQTNGKDFIGTLRAYGKEKLILFVHSYQSLLWNKLAKQSKKKILPLPGYLTQGKEYNALFIENGIVKGDFLFRSFPELSVEGGERKRIINVQNFKTIAFEKDEVYDGKKKQIVSFFLEKGSYATVVIRALAEKNQVLL